MRWGIHVPPAQKGETTLKTKHYIRIIASVILTGALAVSAMGAAHAQTSAGPSRRQPSVTSAPLPRAVQIAMPYVHVVNYTASIDPEIVRVLSPADVAIVTSLVARYNSIPVSVKSHPIDSKVGQALGPHPYLSCSGASFHAVLNWYGPSVSANECATQNVSLWLAGGIAIVTLASALCGPAEVACIPLATALIALGGGELVLIQGADHGNGVWFNLLFGILTTTTR